MHEAHQPLKNLIVYDPLYPDATTRDSWVWFATVKTFLMQHTNYISTYILIQLVSPTFTEQILKSSQNIPVPSLPLITLACLYKKDVYCQRKINPLEVTEYLKVEQDKVLTQEDLYQQVIDLHFSRNDHMHPLVCCYELAIAVGIHLSDRQQVIFNNSILTTYPGLQQTANRIKGRALKASPDHQ